MKRAKTDICVNGLEKIRKENGYSDFGKDERVAVVEENDRVNTDGFLGGPLRH